MAQPLPIAIGRYNGDYNTLFTSGQILLKDPKKGWVISRKPISTKNKAEFFDQLVRSLLAENFHNIPKPEALVIRMNVCIQNPPIPRALPEVILFKSTCKTFGFLSNFFPSLIVMNGKLFRSSEHFYQWRIISIIDAERKEDHYQNMCQLEPLKSREYSHRVQRPFREPEEGEKLKVMREVATLKFMQNPPLAEALVATHPIPLVENTESFFWGGDANHMGKILEHVREMLVLSKD